MKTMDKKEFLEKVMSEIREQIPTDMKDDVDVTERTVIKTNDTEFYAISIKQKDENFASNIMLDDIYRHYEYCGKSDKVIPMIAKQCVASIDRTPEAATDPCTYENIADNLNLRILELARNRKYLDGVPYMPVGNGLVMVCDLRIFSKEYGMYSTKVTEDLMKDNGYSRNKLFETAMENMMLGYPPIMLNIEDALMDKEIQKNFLCEKKDEAEEDLQRKIYVLTNEYKMMGAVVLFYPGIQERIAEILGEGYYVLPSSIHDVMIVPRSFGLEPGKLRQMIKDANANIVGPEEILSDNLFYYDISKKQLNISQCA